MTCEDFHELVSAYIDQELSDDEMGVVQEHLARCKSCQELFHELESLSRFTTEAFMGIFAPESTGTAVLERIASLRQSEQRSRVSWIAIDSAIVMTLIAIGVGGGLVWSFSFVFAGIFYHLLRGLDVLTLHRFVGGVWLWPGVLVVGVAVAVVCISAIRRLLVKPLDPTASSS